MTRSLTLLLVFLFIPVTASAQASDINKLVGAWSGESICANKDKFPACKDEHVVYHVKLTPNKTASVTMTMNKVVDGKEEFMVEGEFVYDQKKQTLISEFKNTRVHLTIEFVVNAGTIEGIVASLPERTIVRNIKVKKDK